MNDHRDERPADRDTIERAVVAAWQLHEPTVVRYAAHLLGGDVHRAQDVAQETVIRLWTHHEVLGRAGSLRGWLCTVAKNIIVDQTRRRSSRSEVAVDEESPAHEPGVDDHADAVAAAVTWDAVLHTLDSRHRAAIELVYLEGLSVKRAAMRLGVPVGTIKSRCHNGLKVLRGRLPMIAEVSTHQRDAA